MSPSSFLCVCAGLLKAAASADGAPTQVTSAEVVDIVYDMVDLEPTYMAHGLEIVQCAGPGMGVRRA